MKLLKIIWKNIKLLMRSKISALIIILGPLLIIFLVGFSFSTSSPYAINIGVFSEQYNELTESFIDKMNEESFSLTRYDSQQKCIDDIKYGQIHTCIIFPSDLKVENQKTNEIVFFVDQSKINLVYLVINTLSKSLSNRTSEISVDLTTNIVDTLFSNRKNMFKTLDIINNTREENEIIYADADFSGEKLEGLDLEASVELNSTFIASPSEDIISSLNFTVDEVHYIVKKAFEMIEFIDDEYSDVNISQLDPYVEEFIEINDTVAEEFTGSVKDIKKLRKVINDLDENIQSMVDKLTVTKMAKRDVMPRLEEIKERSDIIKSELNRAEEVLTESIGDIDSVEVTSPENIVSPITTRIQEVVTEKTTLNYMFPSLIILLIMFVGLMLPSLLIIIEKNSSAYFRVFTAPTKDYIYIITDYLTSVIVLFLQVTVILLVSEYYFKINLLSDIYSLLLVILVIATVFIFIGMLIGYLFNTEEIATIASVSLGSVFLFTSGLIFPLESMPSYLIDKAKFNPFVLGSEIFKKIILFSVDIMSLKESLLILLGYSFVLVVIIVLIQKISKIRLLNQITAMKQIFRELLKDFRKK